MSPVTTRLQTPLTHINARQSWIPATLISRRVCSFCGQVLPTVVLKALLSQQMFILKRIKPRDLLDHSGDLADHPTVTLTLLTLLRALVIAGLGACRTSTRRLSLPTLMRTGPRVTGALHPFNDSRVHRRRINKCARDTPSLTVDSLHLDEASRHHLQVPAAITSLTTKPASLKGRPRYLRLQELPTPTGAALHRPHHSSLPATPTV